MTSYRIVDPAARDLFLLKDAEFSEANSQSSSDRAVLRHLALRAVGLQERGFTNEEQVPWSDDPVEFKSWLQNHLPSIDCLQGIDAVRLNMSRLSPSEVATHALQQRLQAAEDLPAWETFHALLLNAKSSFGIKEAFDVNAYTNTLEAGSHYTWLAEENMGVTSTGRVFVNPVAAARWVLDHEPGIKGSLMHASQLRCPDTNQGFEVNDHGTSKWANKVLSKIEHVDLFLTAGSIPVTTVAPARPRV